MYDDHLPQLDSELAEAPTRRNSALRRAPATSWESAEALSKRVNQRAL
jgi:hypothetical protein